MTMKHRIIPFIICTILPINFGKKNCKNHVLLILNSITKHISHIKECKKDKEEFPQILAGVKLFYSLFLVTKNKLKTDHKVTIHKQY